MLKLNHEHRMPSYVKLGNGLSVIELLRQQHRGIASSNISHVPKVEARVAITVSGES